VEIAPIAGGRDEAGTDGEIAEALAQLSSENRARKRCGS